MSNKELAFQIVNAIPEAQMAYVVNMLQNFQMAIADAEDDAFCEQMYQNYLNDPDPNKDDVVSLEDCKKEWGIS